jgi:GT2 family glycosyltransferase
MKIIAIIVNYHTAAFLVPLLDILQEESCLDEIFVFDNSQETEISSYEKKYSKVEVVFSDDNVGFAAGVNAITSEHLADYYLLINPDTLPVRGFSQKLIEASEKHNALISGPRFYWDDDKHFRLPPAVGDSLMIFNALNISKKSYSDAQILTRNWAIHHDSFWKNKAPFSQSFLSGACLLIKNDPSFFTDGKIFDELFFLYYEDTDLCIRAMIKNKLIICVPNAEVVHYWDQSPSDNKQHLMQKSQKLFFDKHYSGYNINEESYGNIIDIVEYPVDYLGEFTNSPIFTCNEMNHFKNKFYFEIGLNQVFVPFAQSRIKDTMYQIPAQLWNIMKPGIYFSRIRTATNQVIKLWKWKKISQ